MPGKGMGKRSGGTDRCLSIFPESRYFRSSLRRTLIRRIHWTLVGNRASAVPFLFPAPVCRPLRFAARRSLVRAREWIVVGLTMMCPSLMSLATPFRELAFEISAASSGSSQTGSRERRGGGQRSATGRVRGSSTTADDGLTLPLSDTGNGGSQSLLDLEVGELGH